MVSECFSDTIRWEEHVHTYQLELDISATTVPLEHLLTSSAGLLLGNETDQEHDILVEAMSKKVADGLSLNTVEFRVLEKFIAISKELANIVENIMEFILYYPSMNPL